MTLDSRQESPVFTASIIIEWDNARWSELDRARAMYRVLTEQIHDLARAGSTPCAAVGHQRVSRATGYRVVEVLVLYDEIAIGSQPVAGAIGASEAELPPGVTLRLIGTPGFGYYELKNEGAKRASGDILVFLDSDVIPEPGWLGQLLRSFDDSQVQVVGGNTYIQAVSLYSKTFALAWFFPERAADGPIREAPWFFANSVAFRREVFDRNRFPDEPRFRGQCGTLAHTLQNQGIRIHTNPCARAAHPPPSDVSHFFRRALCEGHDSVVGERLVDPKARHRLRRSFWQLRSNVLQSWQAINRERWRGGFTVLDAPLALGIAVTYYTAYFLGELLTRINPRIVHRWFAI